MRSISRSLALVVCAFSLSTRIAGAQADSSLRVLAVTAHPDDHIDFFGTIYKITHDLRGKVDLVVITNGEGGFKYSTLAESYYGLELTDPKIGRQYLPAIRKKEAMADGEILGIRNYFFLDQPDHDFTLSADSVLKYAWDVPLVKERLKQIMTNEKYDYVLTMLPVDGTHGGHKSATIMALESVRELPAKLRPVVLASSDSLKNKPADFKFTELKGYPVTRVASGASRFHFDLTQKFGYRDALDYRIIGNWAIAEHKSQGTMQLYVNGNDVENFWFFDVNDPSTISRTEALFDRLKKPQFRQRVY